MDNHFSNQIKLIKAKSDSMALASTKGLINDNENSLGSINQFMKTVSININPEKKEKAKGIMAYQSK